MSAIARITIDITPEVPLLRTQGDVATYLAVNYGVALATEGAVKVRLSDEGDVIEIIGRLLSTRGDR